MTAQELQEVRESLGLNIKQFAKQLNTPYRTVQDWLAGTARIPGVVEVAVKALKKERRGKK